MSLEKLIKYDQAVLLPESELERFENNSKIRLKALNHLALLFHFPTPQEYINQTKEAITGGLAVGMKYLCSQSIVADEGPFGAGSNALVDHSLVNGRVSYPSSDLVDQASEFSVQFFFQSDLATSPFYRPLVGKFRGAEEIDQLNWLVYLHSNNELGLAIFTSEGLYLLETYGLNLQADTWHHIRATVSVPLHTFKLFCNGEEVASGEFAGEFLREANPELRNPISFLERGADSHFYSIDKLAEVEWYEVYLSEEYTPPSSSIKPFSQNRPKAQLSLDSGWANANWKLSELSFFDETDFENGGIKIRLDADNDHTPNFSGELLTLAQARNLGTLSGRYLHLEFSFISDGDTQRVLSPGKIGLKSQPLILNRRAPEIISRF